MAMTFDEFVKKYKGKGVDFDKAYGVQCFDLANQFNRDVVGCGMFTGLYAKQIYEDFDKQAVKGYFTKIKNTPSFVPKKGDIVVWGGSLNGGIGHVAIATGEGNTKYFYSYDQNWTGRNDPCTKIKHNYNYVLGVLRPKDQTKINPPKPKVLDKSGFKKGNKSDGVLALKQLLMLAGYKMDNNGTFGEGTQKAVNALLKKWGYSQNGIAGEKLIKKLAEKVDANVKK